MAKERLPVTQESARGRACTFHGRKGGAVHGKGRSAADRHQRATRADAGPGCVRPGSQALDAAFAFVGDQCVDHRLELAFENL